MEGVTILSQDTTLIANGFSPLYIIFISMFIIGLGLMITSIINDWGVAVVLSSFIVLIISAVMLILTPIITAVEVDTYKVIIDDSVSFTEFTNKYEIKDQEGKIFTVYERSDAE